MKNKQGLQGAYRLFAWQLIVTLLFAAGIFFWLGKKEAISVLLGGLVSIIPSFCFAKTLFRHQGARAAKQIVNSFYKGEMFKIVLSVLLFILVFAYFPVNPLIFFVSYIVTQMLYWFAPLIIVNKQNRPESD